MSETSLLIHKFNVKHVLSHFKVPPLILTSPLKLAVHVAHSSQPSELTLGHFWRTRRILLQCSNYISSFTFLYRCLEVAHLEFTYVCEELVSLFQRHKQK